MLQPLSTVTARVVDLARGTIAAIWPRGAVSWEMSRLLEEGYTSGERCDVAFSVYFADPALAAAAAQAVRAARYAVDTTQSSRGFITVHEQMQLRAFDLGLATARLERIVGGYEGFVALIGPTHAPPRATGDGAGTDAGADATQGQRAA
jgi:hypothetical protein